VAVVAVFGAVWGAAEISLGALLRSAAIPMHGMLMAGIGIIIMLVARRSLSAGGQRGRGVVVAVGVVAAAMLPLSAYAGRPRRWRFAVAGSVAALVPPVQMLLWLAAQYGPAALSQFREILLIKQGGERLGLAGQTAGALVALALVVSAVYGVACGTLAWSIAKQILTRLGRVAE